MATNQRYMPQGLFDAGAATVALAKALGQDGASMAKQLAAEYSRDYHDRELATQWIEAGENLLNLLPKLFSPLALTNEQLASACLTLQKAMKQFHLNGEPRSKRWLGGTRFNYESSELPDKVAQCLSNMANYHTQLVKGVIDSDKLD